MGSYEHDSECARSPNRDGDCPAKDLSRLWEAAGKVDALCENQKQFHDTFMDYKKAQAHSFAEFKEDLLADLANCVVKEAFWPVKTLVYGAAGIMLTSIMGALMALILKSWS